MTQNDWVLNAIKKRWITAMDALNGCGCFRLAARIKDLRDEGYKIQTIKVERNGKHFAAYKLINAKGQ